jgi:lysophospholipase L1-like esterase
MLTLQRNALFWALAGTAVARTIMVGDSILASDHKIQRVLESHAGHAVENYALIGASLHEGWVVSVPQQYADVPKTPPIDVVVLNGGGNDVMSHRADCDAFNEACQATIREARDIAWGLLSRLASDGVRHALYVGFHRIPGLEQAAAYGASQMQAICVGACVFVDLANVTVPLGWDGLHPSDEGYDRIAQAIWQASQVHGIAL